MSGKAPSKPRKVNADNVEPGISGTAPLKSPEVNEEDVVPPHDDMPPDVYVHDDLDALLLNKNKTRLQWTA